MNRTTIVLAGYFGFGNAGDELIRLSVRAAAPGGDWRVLGVDADRWNPLSLSRLFQRSRALLYGGGELFQARTSLRSLLYYAALPALARARGARFLAYGMGLDPALAGWALRLTVAALDRAERVWFRDEESLELYRRAGGKAPAGTAPDPVWTWEAGGDEPPASLKSVLWVPREPAPAASEGPVLFMHPRLDRRVLGNLSPVEEWESPEDLIPLFRRHDAVVSMRYHGLVLAALAGRPAAAMAAHGKVASLAKALGCPVLAPGASREEVRRAVENSFSRRGEIRGRAARFREEARRGLAELSDALRSL